MRLILTIFLSLLILFSGQFQIIDIQQHTKSMIHVTVHGEVLREGVISLKPYATLEELITFVGLTNDADISSLNLATVLHDKDVLTIPAKTSEKQINLISINTADFNALLQIPKIGEKTAQAIIDYRNQYGLFHSLEDLMKVKGIGQAKFDFIKDKICL
ncbi:ComEA family DNA-binding protein [uncultured Solobacterium sp.]|uniref:ComEA family DNA-binding protein n=1 Tax=uncultured Solobacterium sp. TaxID=747375 RepID=UPI0028E31232|nr:ComEA family DNA-binding protein [uncultured Solobacterium sp.]